MLLCFGILVGLAVSVAVLFAPDEVARKVGWIGVVCCGAALPLGLINLLPGAVSLTLDREGFVVRMLFRNRPKVRWHEITGFVLWTQSRVTFVGYDFRFEYSGRGSAVAAALGAPHKTIGNFFELKPPELAAVMEEWRVRHSAAPVKSS